MNNKPFFLTLFLLATITLAGATGKGDPSGTDTGPRMLEPKSKLARESFKCLSDYLAEKRPDILPLVLDGAWSADKNGSEVTLVCAYDETGRKLWLKALLLRDSKGKQRVTQVVFAYEYDIREE
jgi:hypothetical protein